MTKRKPFKFKQFSIDDEDCGMKIGVDSVLLGSFVNSYLDQNTPVITPSKILDVGSGSGVLSLMLAQKFPSSQITGIDLDTKSLEKSKENITNSPFHNSFISIQGNYLEYEFNCIYDLVISNPPFYPEDVVSSNIQRQIARSSKHLPLLELLRKTKNILSPSGAFYLCYPASDNLEQIIQNAGWKIQSKLSLVKNSTSAPTRCFLHLVCKNNLNINAVIDTQISIEKERGKYTPQYIALTKDYYLNF